MGISSWNVVGGKGCPFPLPCLTELSGFFCGFVCCSSCDLLRQLKELTNIDYLNICLCLTEGLLHCNALWFQPNTLKYVLSLSLRGRSQQAFTTRGCYASSVSAGPGNGCGPCAYLRVFHLFFFRFVIRNGSSPCWKFDQTLLMYYEDKGSALLVGLLFNAQHEVCECLMVRKPCTMFHVLLGFVGGESALERCDRLSVCGGLRNGGQFCFCHFDRS